MSSPIRYSASLNTSITSTASATKRQRLSTHNPITIAAKDIVATLATNLLNINLDRKSSKQKFPHFLHATTSPLKISSSGKKSLEISNTLSDITTLTDEKNPILAKFIATLKENKFTKDTKQELNFLYHLTEKIKLETNDFLETTEKILTESSDFNQDSNEENPDLSIRKSFILLAYAPACAASTVIINKLLIKNIRDIKDIKEHLELLKTSIHQMFMALNNKLAQHEIKKQPNPSKTNELAQNKRPRHLKFSEFDTKTNNAIKESMLGQIDTCLTDIEELTKPNQTKSENLEHHIPEHSGNSLAPNGSASSNNPIQKIYAAWGGNLNLPPNPPQQIPEWLEESTSAQTRTYQINSAGFLTKVPIQNQPQTQGPFGARPPESHGTVVTTAHDPQNPTGTLSTTF